jgi:hypothetical protein
MAGWKQPVQEQPKAMSGIEGGVLPAMHGGHKELTFIDRVAGVDDDEVDMRAL